MTQRTCERCGEPARSRFCSSRCANQRRGITTYVALLCARCGKTFVRTKREASRYPTHYCCKSCARRGHSVALVGPIASGPQQRIADRPKIRVFTARRCRCGEWIITIGQRVPTTCGSCQPRRIMVAGQCQECATPYVVSTWLGGSQTNHCSRKCWKRYARRKDKQARSKRIRNTTKRDRVGLPSIAKRDGWTCHICKRKVARKDWSLDHLVPLSHGGTHTLDNVALAHRHCNTKRGNRGEAQLLLIG